MYKVSDSGEGTPLAWYPASGSRHNDTGALYGISNDGYSYSSAVNGIRGVFLYFIAHGLATSDAYRRGSSFPLRCLSE